MSVLSCILSLLALALLLQLSRLPARPGFRLVRNTVCGYVSLMIVNLFSFFTGAAFSLNIVTAVIVGFLGLPGIGLLFFTRWLVFV